jgi:hypothetical protein
MAGCKISSGVTAPGCSDRFSSPGINREDIWVFNHSEISAYTAGAQTGEVSAITFSPSYETGFIVATHKNSAQFLEELQVSDEAAPYYKQTFSARVISKDTDTRNAIENMVDVDLVLAFKQRNGKFRVIGQTGGVKLTEQVYDTGKTEGDAIGDTLVFTGVENGKAKFFFDTSETATKATLDSYL